MANRANYLAAIQATNGTVFTPKDIALSTRIDPAKIRVWLMRDKVKGLVISEIAGKWRVVSNELIAEEIRRNTVTEVLPSVVSKAKNAQICRLHDIQFKANLLYDSRDSLKGKLSEWRYNASPGVDHYWSVDVPMPEIGCRGKFHIAAGKHKAALQLFIDPIWCNSFRLFDQLESIHGSAQSALKWLAVGYNVSVALLEVTREGHYAISIPAKEGWRLQKVGYKRREHGKLWITDDWSIDESYGEELETMRARAFGDLMDGLQKVGGIQEKVDAIYKILSKLQEPDHTHSINPMPGTGEEVG